MGIKTVSAEWVHIEDNPPNKKAMCLCEDGKIRFGYAICGDGYFYIENKDGWKKIEFWQEIPDLRKSKKHTGLRVERE